MAVSNEEQLLKDLLSAIAREDAGLDAAHLETRVVEASDARTTVRLAAFAKATAPRKADPTYMYVGIAAAVVIAVMVPGFVRMTRDVSPTNPTNLANLANLTNLTPPTRPTRPTRPAFAPLAPRRGEPTRPMQPTPPAFAPLALRRGEPTRPTPPTRLSSDEFVPLMPMTEQDLAGPFQLVRVQMPRASLGALRSPLEYPNELVEAEVLLGEDGMARAIRVSTGGSVYPWRSR